MSLSAGVLLLAERVAEEVNALRSEIADPEPLGGWVDCSGMDTAAEINAAASAAAAFGSVTIWLGHRGPSNPLSVEETLVFWPRQRWLGGGGKMEMTCLEADSELAAGDPVMAAHGFMNNQTDADEGVWIQGIHIDMMGMTGRHGLVVFNFWSTFYDIQVANADGAGTHSFHVTNLGRDGTTVSMNTHSENRFMELRGDSATNEAIHFYSHSQSPNNNANLDGHLLDCYFAGAGGHSVHIVRSAGWTVWNVHIYGVGRDALRLENLYGTKVIGNYIEGFGDLDESTGFYGGIVLTNILDTRASVCALNTISTTQPDSPAAQRFTCLSIRPGYAQDQAYLVVVGNAMVFADDVEPTVKRSVAVRIGEGADPQVGETPARFLQCEYSANLIQDVTWWQAKSQVATATCRVDQGITTVHAGIAGGYPALDVNARIDVNNMPLSTSGSRSNAAATGTYTADATLNGNNRDINLVGDTEVEVPTGGINGQIIQLTARADGADRTLTFDAGFALLEGVLDEYVIPNGKKLRAAIRYSDITDVSGDEGWTVEAVGIQQ